MQYFDYLNKAESKEIFYSQPKAIAKNDDKNILAHGLGATMYVPATKKTIATDIINHKFKGLTSLVFCLEDAIGDLEVEHAESMVAYHLLKISTYIEKNKDVANKLPFMFIRVRDPEQLFRLEKLVGAKLAILTGFIFPKVTIENYEAYFNTLMEINERHYLHLYAMPILESSQVIYKETRTKTLFDLKQGFEKYRDYILNLRIGATDFSSYFGLRRRSTQSIYEIGVIRDCIVDILNVFGRAEDGYVISGPVWEYFQSSPTFSYPPHQQEQSHYTGLINELHLDKANGFIGKTIIHPTQITPVQSMYVVSYEEYLDAKSILENSAGHLGVMKSHHNNKMNEIKPHLSWANKIITLSKIYGVFNEGKDYRDLLSEELSVQYIGSVENRHQLRKRSL